MSANNLALASILKLKTSVPVYIKPWDYGGTVTPINDSTELPKMLKVPYVGCSPDEPGAIQVLNSGGASGLPIINGIGYKIKSMDPSFEIGHIVATSEKTKTSGAKLLRDEYLELKISKESQIRKFYQKEKIELRDYLRKFYKYQENNKPFPLKCHKFLNTGKPFGLRTKDDIDNTIEVETKLRNELFLYPLKPIAYAQLNNIVFEGNPLYSLIYDMEGGLRDDLRLADL
ncbi:MAG: hypothetical protein KAS12_07370 [Candidatus Aenigmarchaeota archaeon]|nr:hypothetical protein [Candidatus Aenigmarchaeota archaeon]